MNRRIRLGMVGGGAGSFIGGAHRVAARLDDEFELVAAALSSDPARARSSGDALRLDPSRCYADYAEMARAEAARDDGIDAVAIVTPNHLHVPVASAFVEQGIHVICDKPLAISLAEATRLREQVRRSGLLFMVTHTYSGYPMVRHARELVRQGVLGELRVVQVEYAQDWLAEPLEATGHKQAEWRADPARNGPGGALGDIGTHAFHLAGYVSGLKLESLSAEVHHFVPGRRLDDHVQAMLRYAGGARGMLWASQVATGNANHLQLRLFGSRGGLHFDQEQPEQLALTMLGEPTRLVRRGATPAEGAGAAATRLPGGHPEGYFEAFGQLYRDFAVRWRLREAGQPVPEDDALPGIDDGCRGMAFIEAVLKSHAQGGAWTGLAE